MKQVKEIQNQGPGRGFGSGASKSPLTDPKENTPRFPGARQCFKGALCLLGLRPRAACPLLGPLPLACCSWPSDQGQGLSLLLVFAFISLVENLLLHKA